jgi:hypothetical protein
MNALFEGRLIASVDDIFISYVVFAHTRPCLASIVAAVVLSSALTPLLTPFLHCHAPTPGWASKYLPNMSLRETNINSRATP